MALSAVKTWIAAEVLTASDLNAEFANIRNNPVDLWSPAGKAADMNSFKITSLAAATARTDAASLASIQDGTGVYVATVGGTADAITLTPSPAIAAYAAGQRFSHIASGANTTAVTIAVSGLAAKAGTKNGTTALVGGDIPSGALVTWLYDGTRFQIDSVKRNDTGAPLATVVKRKTADEAVTSSTTLQDDDHLTFAIAANEEWVAHYQISCGALLSTTGLKVTLTWPTGATADFDAYAIIRGPSDTRDIHVGNSRFQTSGQTVDMIAAGFSVNNGKLMMSIWILNGSTAGSVTLQFAQSSSSGSALTFLKGAHLIAHRIA